MGVAEAVEVGDDVGEVVVSGGIVSVDSGDGLTFAPGLTGCTGISGPKARPTTTTATIATAKRTAKIDLRLL